MSTEIKSYKKALRTLVVQEQDKPVFSHGEIINLAQIILVFANQNLIPIPLTKRSLFFFYLKALAKKNVGFDIRKKLGALLLAIIEQPIILATDTTTDQPTQLTVSTPKEEEPEDDIEISLDPPNHINEEKNLTKGEEEEELPPNEGLENHFDLKALIRDTSFDHTSIL